MPDFAAHSIFGEALLPTPQVQTIIAGQGELAPWQWGLQGPDPLFFRGGTAPVGGRMHRGAPEGLFQAMTAHLAAMPAGPQRDAAKAWLWGFLAHYALDRTVHPYVLASQGIVARWMPGATGNALHYQVETDMDTDLYFHVHRRPVREMDPSRGMALAPWQKEAVGAMLAAGAWGGFGIPLLIQDAVRALDSMAFTQRLIFGGGRPLRAAARGVETLMGKRGQLTGHMKGERPRWDSLNLGRAPWTDPRDGKTRTDTVPELLDRAKEEVLPLMEALERQVDAASPAPLPLGGVDFSGYAQEG